MKYTAGKLFWILGYTIGVYLVFHSLRLFIGTLQPYTIGHSMASVLLVCSVLVAVIAWPVVTLLAIQGHFPGCGDTGRDYWLCQQCGYNMRTVPGATCPECGTEHSIAEQKDR